MEVLQVPDAENNHEHEDDFCEALEVDNFGPAFWLLKLTLLCVPLISMIEACLIIYCYYY